MVTNPVILCSSHGEIPILTLHKGQCVPGYNFNNNNNNNNNNGLISVHPWYGSSPDIRLK